MRLHIPDNFKTTKYLAIFISIIFIMALGLRLIMVNNTVVTGHLRADAGEYYLYVVNLKHFGIYSHSDNLLHESKKSIAPEPDARRTPGYSLFLYPFVEYPPSKSMFNRILVAQAILSAITILIAFLFFQKFIPWWGALSASFLTAISPHLVAANIYVLTETVFTFFLVCFAYALAMLAAKKNAIWALISGLILGCTILIKPTLSYFLILLIPALLKFYPLKKSIKMVSIIVLGFYVVYGPWVIRNSISVSGTANSTKALDSIHKGMYPNIMYKDDPETFGYPNKYDPGWNERKDLKSVMNEIGDRFSEEPARVVHWYLVGKPLVFFSWNIVVGMGDVFVYPVETSPYHTSKIFYFTHRFMYWLHWPLTALAFFALILVWLPSAGRILSDSQVIVARLSSILILYFLLVHMIGLPLPRYSIPTRPIIFGMSMLGLSALITIFKQRLHRHQNDSA